MIRECLFRAASALVLGGLLAACHADAGALPHRASAPPSGASAAAPAAAASGVHTGSQSVAQSALAGSAPAHPDDMPAAWVEHLGKGDTYAAFRKQALANGWRPAEGGPCQGSSAGGPCAGIPELDGCSADGYCAMRLVHPGADWVMQVNTYGSTADWRQENAHLRVIGWDFVRQHGR